VATSAISARLAALSQKRWFSATSASMALQSFGWTIRFHWPVAVLTGAISLIYAATVLAGFYPARIAVQLNPIEVVHEE